MTVDLDWENLGFNYRKLPFRYISYFKDGKWDEGQLTEDATLHISEASPALHYGQEAFEGLKAYRTKDGSIQLFRPDENAKRLQRTADRLLMPQVSVDKFVDACKQVVLANEEYVPPYGTGATLYLRPLLIGVGETYSSLVVWLQQTSLFKMIMTVLRHMVQVLLRLVVTTQQVCCQVRLHMTVTSLMLSTLIQQLTLRLKKWVLQTSLVSQPITNSLHHSAHLSCHLSLSSHCFTWLKIALA